MKTVENIRFQLEINGESVCISGVNGFGVLSAIVDWVKRDPRKFDASKLSDSTLEVFSREHVSIHFGGLDSNEAERSPHLVWHKRELEVGDTVSIRILGPGPVDDSF